MLHILFFLAFKNQTKLVALIKIGSGLELASGGASFADFCPEFKFFH